MRKIVIFDRVSADGYFSTSDGNLDWVVPDDEIDKAAGESMPHSDMMLFGRRTYEMFEAFWPKALEDANASDPHAPGRHPPGIHAMAAWINDSKKWVFSRTRKEVSWKNSQLFHEFDPKQINALKQEPGGSILVFGSGSVASQLTEHGLADEYHLIVGPKLLGSGRPLISGVSKQTKLELVEAKPYPSGNVVLRYATVR